jgi:hypothetical protein
MVLFLNESVITKRTINLVIRVLIPLRREQEGKKHKKNIGGWGLNSVKAPSPDPRTSH